ncbi:hypothetical protein D3C78_413940 [compost metagenome]
MPVGDVDRRFGRAITVVQRDLGQHVQHPVAQRGRQRLTAGEHAPQAVAAGRLWFLDKYLQQRRHKVQGRHAMLAHQRSDALRITVLTGACQHQSAPCDQWPEAFPDRNVETDRGLLHQHILLIQRVMFLHPLQALGQGRVRIAYALGLTGGTGGVDHIGEVIAVQVQAGWLARPAVELELIHGDGADTGHLWQPLQHIAMAEQQARAAVTEHVGQAFSWIVHIQRHISTTGFENGQHTDQQLRRTFSGDGHTHIRTDALVTQVMGQAVGLLMQAGIVEATALPHQRSTLRGQPGLLIQLLDDPLLSLGRSCLPPMQQLLTALCIEQLQIANGQARRCTGLLQHTQQLRRQTLHTAGVE